MHRRTKTPVEHYCLQIQDDKGRSEEDQVNGNVYAYELIALCVNYQHVGYKK